MKDYYAILGVPRDASAEEVKKAFRSLARESHPDANPGDPTAEERFREVAEAYEVLSDPQRRAAYDRGDQFVPGDLFSSFAGLDELLQQFFGGGGFGFGGSRTRTRMRRGPDVAVAIELTLAEAAFGSSRDITYRAPSSCSACGGDGAEPGHPPVTCTTCNGRGSVQVTRNTMLGAMVTVGECRDCMGRGTRIEVPCAACSGRGVVDEDRTLTVEIPAGVDDASRLRLTGRGGAGEPGAPPGDLYVQLHVQPDERFERVGDDLHHRIEVGIAEAALGSEVDVPLLEGDPMPLEIPPGTQPNTSVRIPREGMGRLRRRGRGDLIVEIDVVVPDKLTDAEADALREYARLRGESPGDGRRKKRRWAR
jgi:molecular chaperone DnaJ